jgi:deoxyribonuclease V
MSQSVIVCLDVGYFDSTAISSRHPQGIAAAVAILNWEDPTPIWENQLHISDIEPYVPGEFYKRELPCLRAVLDTVPYPIQCIVVDSYVWLDAAGKAGLGGHLYEALGQTIPVIGVAKTRFQSATTAAELCRGKSQSPLFISSAGIELPDAISAIQKMEGEHRIPTLLKRVDRLSRSA